jgi:hypothetical protein
MNHLDISIIIQKELELCNEKIKKYDKKYNPEKNEKIELLFNYLMERLEELEQLEQNESVEHGNPETEDLNKKLLLDDIETLSNYINNLFD